MAAECWWHWGSPLGHAIRRRSAPAIGAHSTLNKSADSTYRDRGWPGHARMRATHPGGRVTYHVQYLRDGSNALDVFPAERVRLDETDRSLGR